MIKISAVIFVILFVVVATGLGWSVIARLDRGKALTPWEKIGLAYGCGALGVHFGIFIIGRIRLDAISMGSLGLALFLAAIPGLRSIPWKNMASDIANLGRRASQDFLLLLFLSAIIAATVSGILQGMAPPNDYDSLMYHIALPQYDTEIGRIAPAWRWTLQTFFPALMENLYRLGLSIAGEPAVQMLHGIFAPIAALAASQIARRFGFGMRTAALAALMFISVRAVVWEMATCEVDLALAAYTSLGLLAYMTWRSHKTVGLMIVFGFMLGGALNVKYLGFPIAIAFAPVLLADFIVHRVRQGVFAWQFLIGPFVSFLTILPQSLYSFWYTKNPVFPLFNNVFNPGGPIFFEDTPGQYGTGRSLEALLRAPWDMSITPTYFFDGVILGAPYLLAFLPFALLGRRRHHFAWPAIGVAAVYYIEWFWLLSQQVRFLMPIFPIVCIFAATGAAILWEAMRENRIYRLVYICAALVLAANQGLFVGIYSAIRLPAALGLTTPEAYHAKTPTLGGAFYKTCMYVRNNLKPGERYLSMLAPHFYYCPQASAIMGDRLDNEILYASEGRLPLPLSGQELLDALDNADIRFVIVQTAHENRRNESGQPEMQPSDANKSRFGQHLMPLMENMAPLSQDAISAVYDGRIVRQRLRDHLASTSP